MEGKQIVAVLDLTKMGCTSPLSFPKKMKLLLENPRLVPVAVNISADVPRLTAFGVHFERGVDVIHLAKQYEPKGSKGFGMSKLVPRYLKMQVEKTNQIADWMLMSKSLELKRYAALDAYLHM